MIRLLLSALTLAFATPVIAQAGDKNADTAPAVFKRLVDCRSVVDREERFQCYEREVTAIAEAEKRKDLIVMDRQQIREKRKSLFGLNMPKIKLFNGDETDDAEPEELKALVTAAHRNNLGKWIITLDNGTVWQQVDSQRLALDPETGDEIRIRKASLGSYFANVARQTAIRIQRTK